jgi:hypothetical protein
MIKKLGFFMMAAVTLTGATTSFGHGDDFRPRPPHHRPGGFGQYQCSARDAGFEEHRFAHVGYGRSLQQAQYAAVAECQRFHGRCYSTGCQRVR